MKNSLILTSLLIIFSCSSKSDNTNDLVDGLGGLEMVDADSSIGTSNEANLIDLALNEPTPETTIAFPEDGSQTLDLAALDSSVMDSETTMDFGTQDASMIDLSSGPEVTSSDTGTSLADTSSQEVKSNETNLLADSNTPEYPEEVSSPKASVSEDTLEFQTYKVKRGDTLMLIAFNLFGDYTKWQDLQDWNNLSSTQLSAGMNLKYKMYMPKYEWNPQGTPYLIQWGDTLGKIADSLYGDLTRWKDLWTNNKPLIRDPNKIYAGFTLYYLP